MPDIPADWEFHSILIRCHLSYVAFEQIHQKWKVVWVEKPQTFAIESGEKQFMEKIYLKQKLRNNNVNKTVCDDHGREKHHQFVEAKSTVN